MRMKKITATLLLSVASMLPLGAFARNSSPVFDWGNLFDGATAAGDQSQNISLAADGSVYWHNVGGSTEAAPEIFYAGEKLFDGVLYNAGNSNNSNLALLKTDSDGKLIWCLHSSMGDFATNQGRVASTSDGGAIFTGRVRHSDAMFDRPIVIVDGKGEEWTYDWSVERRYYRLMVGRVDSEGALQWVKFIECDTDPAPAASGNNAEFTAEGCSIDGLALDDDGNIYISGNFRKKMHIPSADGEVVLEPRNIESWSGDPQGSAGSLYLVKLNDKGEYVSNLEASGSTVSETVSRLVWYDGSLFFQGLIYGKDGSEVKIADRTISPQGDFSPLLGCLDADLNIRWLNLMKGEKVGGKFGFQNCSVSICDDTLWFVGQFNGAVSGADGTEYFASSQGNMREGFLAKFDAESGEFFKGVSSRASFTSNVLTGYIDAIQNPAAPSKVYVFGYGMNAAVGVFLRPYDATTLEADPEEAWTLASQGGVPSCQSCAYDRENVSLYFTARGNKPFECSGNTMADNQAWAVLMAKYTLPESDFPTGIKMIEDVDNGAVDSSNAVTVFDIAGRRVGVMSQDEINSLPAGLYIAAGRKYLVR